LPREAAIMGMADGLTTGIGLVLGMTVTGQGATAIWAAGVRRQAVRFPRHQPTAS
jgi:hypothetical protein